MFRVIPGVLLLLTLFACASSSDMDMLTRDIDNLKRDTTESKKEIGELKERTAKAVGEEQFNALREGQGELNIRVTEITSGLQELRGRFEEGRYYQEKILKDSTAEKDLLKAQLAGLETQVRALRDRLAVLEETVKNRSQAETEQSDPDKAGQPEQAKTADAQSEGTADKDNGRETEKKEPDTSGDRLYNTAYQLFKDRQYKESREKFEAFIKGSPGNKLAGNAQFWIAETYYSEKDYESAILAYEALLKKYPGSDKTTGALLKQGFAFADIGDKKTAKVILGKLIQKYPNSKDAALAKKRLAEIEKKPVKKK